MNSSISESPVVSPTQSAVKSLPVARTAQIALALIKASLREMLRRKDLYVVIVLLLLLVMGTYSFTFFGVSGLEIFVKDMAMTSVNLFATIIGAAVATRQLPEEITRRTIYPMLARPITRWQLLFGKFLAAYVTTLLVFLVLVAFVLVLLRVFGLTFGLPILLQYIYMKSLSFLWLCGFGVFISVYMSQAAAFTITLLLCLGSGAFNRAFGLGMGPENGPNALIMVVYGFLPHYSLFDITSKLVYGWAPIPAYVPLAMTVYGVVIGFFWLLLGWLKFRKQAI